jgi:hypothetical protein
MGVYDIASNTWTVATNPLGQGTGNIASHDGLLYLAVFNSFVSYNPATGTTTTLASPPDFTNAVGGGAFARRSGWSAGVA